MLPCLPVIFWGMRSGLSQSSGRTLESSASRDARRYGSLQVHNLWVWCSQVPCHAGVAQVPHLEGRPRAHERLLAQQFNMQLKRNAMQAWSQASVNDVVLTFTLEKACGCAPHISSHF